MNLVDPEGRLPILPLIWGIYEFGSLVYDIYNAYDVLSNENSTTGEKASSLTGLAMTIFLPGNWGTAANKVDDVIRYADDAIRYTDDVVDAGRVVNKAEDVVDTGKATTRIEKLHEKAKIGQEAHRKIETKLKKESGAEIEQVIEIGEKTVRKDAIMPDGTLVIIKPNTPTGHKAAQKRGNLMRGYGYKIQTIFYDPNDPTYLPGSSTYIGPKK